MRALIPIAFFLLATLSAFAHRDRIEHPQALAIIFEPGDRATFVITNSVVTNITLHIGSKDYAIPAAECAKLRDIQFESVALLWNGSYKSAAEADYFYLRFDMGTESAKAFGELPRVELVFKGRKFEEATIKKKTASDTWQYSKL